MQHKQLNKLAMHKWCRDESSFPTTCQQYFYSNPSSTQEFCLWQALNMFAKYVHTTVVNHFFFVSFCPGMVCLHQNIKKHNHVCKMHQTMCKQKLKKWQRTLKVKTLQWCASCTRKRCACTAFFFSEVCHFLQLKASTFLKVVSPAVSTSKEKKEWK